MMNRRRFLALLAGVFAAPYKRRSRRIAMGVIYLNTAAYQIGMPQIDTLRGH